MARQHKKGWQDTYACRPFSFAIGVVSMAALFMLRRVNRTPSVRAVAVAYRERFSAS